jgi:Putative auto-transporter adhesin, head GIN domain
MKNLLFPALLFLIPLFLSGQTNVNRSLPAFNKIAISGGYDKIILQEGSSESVKLDLNGIDAENIVTEVVGNTLRISTKNGSWRNFKAIITVTYRQITEIAGSGSTNVEALSVIKADKFKLATSGSGDFKGAFDVQSLDVAISGSSDMTLSGRAENQEIAISGSGDVNASALSGTSADVAISGSGDVKLGVKGKVKTAVSGSGTVTNNL